MQTELSAQKNKVLETVLTSLLCCVGILCTEFIEKKSVTEYSKKEIVKGPAFIGRIVLPMEYLTIRHQYATTDYCFCFHQKLFSYFSCPTPGQPISTLFPFPCSQVNFPPKNLET